MPTALLSMTNVSKAWGGNIALSGASLEVLPGEVHALIGQNGAGKSTMIKILTGYYVRDAGEVKYEGKPFSAKSPRDAQSKGVSTIYQEINLVPLRSVTENICLGREIKKFGFLNWKAMHEEARGLLAKFNINIDVELPLAHYSTATQQLVAIARAIAFKARLVIMDEPTSSLASHEVNTLFSVIRQLKEQGVSVLFVSHKLDELYEVCDRVTIMRDGRTVSVSDMDKISRLELVSSMLGRSLTSDKSQVTGFGAHGDPVSGEILFQVHNLSDGGIVRNASLSVRKGEISGIAGLLGSGRTETAHMIFGSRQLRSGSMEMNGEKFSPHDPSDAIDHGIGFCTEDRKTEGIVPDLSIADNMMLALLPKFARAGIVDRKAQQNLVESFIKQLEIKCTGPDQKVKELSGGNQQKVLLARWMAMNPKLLILDEPTRGIDVGAKSEIQKLIRKLSDQGLGVLMISSELEEVVEGSDRVVVLRDGQSVAEFTHKDLSEQAIISAMAGEAGAEVRA